MAGQSREKKWIQKQYDEVAAARLARELRISHISAAMLASRGITDIEAADRFLYPKLEHLHDPFLMKDMDKAVERIRLAIARGERICIYGDYDVDGTTSTIILKKTLKLLGADVSYYIPERLKDGYGLREDAMDAAKEQGYQLIISVDTGIRAQQVVEHARTLGLDMIITDHHLPEDGSLPRAHAVLNPKRADCSYPEKNLAGVGVAFKLAQALLGKDDKRIESFMKIAAIGTIADIVPLTGENRIIAKLGLKGLKTPKNFGLKALLEIAGLTGKTITSSDVGLRIGPRINAAGRMDKADAIIKLFDAPDFDTAMKMAQEINEQNNARKDAVKTTLEQAREQIAGNPDLHNSHIIIAAGENWHRGVIGIVATRLVEEYHRPAIVISIMDGLGHGSGRSIPSFHLLNALESCKEVFEEFGGHSHAVGMTIGAENINQLWKQINLYAKNNMTKDCEPSLKYDCELSLKHATKETLEDINRFEPFGLDNPQPVFVTRGAKIVERRVLKDEHLKLKVMQDGRWMDCIWWRGADYAQEIEPSDIVDLAYTLSENIFNGISIIQLVLKDIKNKGTT